MNCDLADFVECNGLFNNDEQTPHVRIDSFGKLEFVSTINWNTLVWFALHNNNSVLVTVSIWSLERNILVPICTRIPFWDF